MKRLVGLVVLAFASAGWAFPQAPPPSDAERDLRAFMKAVSQAIAARDRAALERYHAATFTSITRTGFVHDRAGWIELIAQGGLAVQKTDDEEQFDDELTMHGAAVAVRTNLTRFRFTTQKRDVATKNRTVYARLDGAWRVISHQASLLHEGPLATHDNDGAVGKYALDNGRTLIVAKTGRTLFATLPTAQPVTSPIFETGEGTFAGAGGYGFVFSRDETSKDGKNRIAAVTLSRDGTVLWRAKRVE